MCTSIAKIVCITGTGKYKKSNDITRKHEIVNIYEPDKADISYLTLGYKCLKEEQTQVKINYERTSPSDYNARLVLLFYGLSIDLFSLSGLGSSLGVGIYVVMSYAISTQAGPSFVISVIIAGVATLFAGLCYGELSSRLPKSGSSYMYIYVTLGEILGFIVGWNMIFEHIVTTAIAAKAWSQYLDFLCNGTIKSYVQDKIHWHDNGYISECPDILASGIIILVTVLIAMKVKLTSVILLVLAFFNILIILCLVCIGYFHVKHENWTNPPGFFAHGFSGVLKGAATLMFIFTNVEAVTSASEETKDPCRTVPTSITYTVFICFVLYFCTATATTLSIHILPEDAMTSFPEILTSLHIHGAKFVIAIGGLIGLTASIVGNMFYVSRQIYAISSDGILFKVLSRVNENLKQPLNSVFTVSLISSVVALIFDCELLIQLVSIGTLLSYTIIAISVICLRYQPGTVGLFIEYEDPDDVFMQSTDFTYGALQLDAGKQNAKRFSNQQPIRYDQGGSYSNGYRYGETNQFKRSLSFDDKAKIKGGQNSLYNRLNDSSYMKLNSVVSSTSNGSVSGLLQMSSDILIEPNDTTWRNATIGLLVFIMSSVLFCVCCVCLESFVHLESWVILIIVFIFTLLLVSATGFITKQPCNRTKLFFRTPYVPFIPLLSIFINIFLVASVSITCWLRFIIWMTAGMLLYGCYSYRHSAEHHIDEQEVILYEITDDSHDINCN
ncbi:hypothetical protein ACF0H5_019848 [Mactra antiquata]